MSEQKKNRKSLILHSTVAGGVATAVLLGGFGAFSLWNDDMWAGFNHDISTGELDLSALSNANWRLTQSDGVVPAGTVVDLSTFKASPGDVLTYTADVELTAKASDMLATLSVDPTSYTVDPSLSQYVTVELKGPNGAATDEIPVDATAGATTVPVSVVVTFKPTIPNQVGQDLASAVSLDGMTFQLRQTTNP